MKLVSPLMKKSINQSLLPHLEIHLRCAKNLPAMDISGKSDGFVIFSIGNESVRSTVVEANLNPVWSDRMLLGIPNGDKLNTFDQLVLKVQVFDKDLLSKNDLISEFTVSFKEFKSEGLPLEKIVSLPGAECQKKNSTIDFSITCQNFNQISNSNKPMIANHYTVAMEKKIEAVQAKFEDSNIQFIGSREDIQQRIEAAKKEDAWFKCGNKVGIAPGLEIWRIEKFKVVPVLKETYGHFYDGDSYIILHTFKKENALYWNIHFWLGLNTSIDEMGVAAYKTVELDDLLGGGPVEFREVQGNESDEFLNLFPKGIRILSGGMETGFRHVKPEEYEPRLLQVKGKKNIKITEVPLLFSSLNQGDCFLLDAGLKLVLWEGSACSNMERFKVNQLAQSIQAERGEKPVLIIAKDKASTNTAELSNLYSLLKGDEKDIKTALEGGDDEEQKSAKLSKPIVYKLSDSSGKMEFSKMQGNFALSNLNSNDAYIVDAGYKVFTWIGKNSSQNERKYANDFAVTYLRNNGKSLRTQISRVSEGNETATFLEVFNV